jgi:hypothetical protein
MKVGVGQSFLSPSAVTQAIDLPSKLEAVLVQRELESIVIVAIQKSGNKVGLILK